MFKRQTTGSVVCVSCGYLVGVNDDRCYHCGRRNPGLWGFGPALRKLGHDAGFVPFVTGPAWLHGSLLHIVFNLMWIRQLAPAVGELYGPGRMVIIYTVGGVVGFALSSIAGATLGFIPIGFLRGAHLTVGASASIFGLLGALVYYGRRSGSSFVRGQAMSWALTGFVFGFLMPGIDNYAHAGGFAGGYLAGRWLDPLKPERINHMAIAVICLALSVLSIFVSVAHALWIIARS